MVYCVLVRVHACSIFNLATVQFYTLITRASIFLPYRRFAAVQ